MKDKICPLSMIGITGSIPMKCQLERCPCYSEEHDFCIIVKRITMIVVPGGAGQFVEQDKRIIEHFEKENS